MHSPGGGEEAEHLVPKVATFEDFATKPGQPHAFASIKIAGLAQISAFQVSVA